MGKPGPNGKDDVILFGGSGKVLPRSGFVQRKAKGPGIGTAKCPNHRSFQTNRSVQNGNEIPGPLKRQVMWLISES